VITRVVTLSPFKASVVPTLNIGKETSHRRQLLLSFLTCRLFLRRTPSTDSVYCCLRPLNPTVILLCLVLTMSVTIVAA
jgi:hypothetical protein